MQWQPISEAPKDGTVILVNDRDMGGLPWSAASWFASERWSGWMYEDELLRDAFPLGPSPTHFLLVPPVPSADQL